MSSAACAAAKKTFDADWSKYFVVEVTSALCREAGELAGTIASPGSDSRSVARTFVSLALKHTSESWRRIQLPHTQFR